MSWDELLTRLQQEAGKRLDAMFYRPGSSPPESRVLDKKVASGKFLFSAEELPERIRLLQQYLPNEMDACVREADDICRHRFHLLGYNALDYGQEIDWHLDAVNRKRTQLIPWYKINFLDFSVTGDHKIIWELNRHQHLVTLAKAWLLTHDEKYAKEAIAQWYAWQQANPYPLGVNWASSLEVAFRSLSWLWMQHLLTDCPAVPARLAPDLQRALALNGRHIERYLSTYFSPNTHLLGEAVALFFLGTLCPQLSRAEKWKHRGWVILQQQAQRQVRRDGVYFESSLYYHVYALDFFLHARVLASRNACEIPPRFDEVIRKMLAVVQSLAQAGPPLSFGDDDGGRVFNPQRNRSHHMTDPLAVGAALFQDDSLHAVPSITEEAIWLFGKDALPNAKAAHQPPQSHAFPDSGLYVIAHPDQPGTQALINAGPPGGGHAHAHADALSLQLSFADRHWLVDPGTYVYVSQYNEREIFRGTRSHNTLAIDGLDQAESAGPFAWNSLPDIQVEKWIPGVTFTFFSGSHSGYQRLAPPVRHHRSLFHLHNSFWLVRDLVDGTGSHLLETSWHFAPQLSVATIDANFVASSRRENQAAPNAAHLTLVPVSDPQWKCHVTTEFVSPVYGTKATAPVLRCSATLAHPAEHAMLLLPSTEKPTERARLVRSAQTPAVYTYDSAQTRHCMIFRQTKLASWTYGPWASDACFLYFCVQDHRISHMVCCEASFLRLHGEPVFQRDASLQYLEWLNRKGERWTNASDEAAARSLSVKAIEASI